MLLHKGRDSFKIPWKTIFMLIPSSPSLAQHQHTVSPWGPAALGQLWCFLQGHGDTGTPMGWQGQPLCSDAAAFLGGKTQTLDNFNGVSLKSLILEA